MKNANIDKLFEAFGKVMTVRELADTIHVSPNYIRSLLWQNEIPCFRIGKYYRLLKKDVLDYFDQKEGEAIEQA